MKTLGRLLCFCIFFALFLPSHAQINFSQGSSFKYLKGIAATTSPDNLLAASFNDANWSVGLAPFRYGKGAGGTLLSDMQNAYCTFFLRSNFSAQNAAYINKMTFTVNYDDGFVIFVNGKQALRINTPTTTLTNTSLALANHDPGTNVTYTVDATGFGLVDGNNTVAVMVLNVSQGSSDIYFDLGMSGTPELPAYDYGNNSVQFSRKGSICKEVFNLTMTSPLPDCNVLYTYDGSDPKTSTTAILGGTSVVLPIDPAQSTGRGVTPGYVVRASLVKTGFKPSSSVTNTYLFLNKVKTQAYPGGKWPSGSANRQIMDYAMAPDVVNNSSYGPYLEAALNQIPSISLVTDNDNLFSVSTGIYSNPTMSGEAWERPCSMELIDTDSTQKFQIDAGVRLRGAASKDPSNPKHAFRMFFGGSHSPSKLQYPLFGAEGADEFDCMDLRCEQNYSWSKDGSIYNNLVTDIFSRDLQGKMGQPYKRGRYYHLYLNGMYWGIFQTDERGQADFATSYLGGNSDDWDVIKVNSDNWPYVDEVTDGNIDAWSALWNKCITGFDSNANYFAIDGKLSDGTPDPNGKVWVDIDNLIDYMLVIFYTGNFDAPVSAWYGDDMPNNYYALYNRNDKTKGFRFLAHDSEHSLFVNAVYGAGITENRVNIGSTGKMVISKLMDFNPQWLHYRLSKNAEYRTRFMDRAYRELTTGGTLTPEFTASLYESRAAQINSAIIAESARWGDAKTSPSLTKQTWLTEIQSKYNSFFPQRTGILRTQLINEGLYPSMITPNVVIDGIACYDRFKYVTGDKLVKLVDPNAQTADNTIYYTLSDIDPRLANGVIFPGASSAKGSVEINLSQTTVLNARLYKSGTWGPLRRIVISQSNEDYTKLKVTELSYHPLDSINGADTISGDDFEFIEFKNIGTKPIDLTGLRLDSAIKYQFPDQQLLYPGSFFVVAAKPNIFFSKYKRYPSGNFSKNFSNSGEEVVLFDRNNKAILQFVYDDAAPWPKTPDGNGYTLTSKYTDPDGNPASSEYWMASSNINGTPFKDDLNALSSILTETQAEQHMMVFPNPTNGLFYVNVGQGQPDARYSVSVYDTKGLQIFQNSYQGTACIDLNRQNVQDGVYIVRVKTAGKTLVQKLIFMH